MLSVSAIRNADARKVEDGPHGPVGGEYPCLVCGRGCAYDKPGNVYVRLHDGGASIVTDAEADGMDPGCDLGVYPIGGECYRKHKAALSPYVLKTK